MVREGERAFAWCREIIETEGPLPCVVRHPNAGGQCGWKAVLEVYALPFCEVHGAEVKAAALIELYNDAADFLERFDNPHVPEGNPAVFEVLRTGVDELRDRVLEAERADSAALRRAYPFRQDQVDEWILDYDPHKPDADLWPDVSL